MKQEGLTEQRWIRGLFIFAFWTALGLFFTLQMAIGYANQGDGVRWIPTLIYTMSQWYAWGLLSPLLLWLARRFSLDRSAIRKSLLRHLGISLLLAPFQVALGLGLRYSAFLFLGTVSLDQVAGQLANAPIQVLTGSFESFAIYWVLLGIYYTFDSYRKNRARELHTSQLEAQLAQAQLTALKMQLHPHFLFNTLHSISALVHTDPDAAERMIARLSDLLRLTLENAGTQEVPLKQELAFLEQYLEIEQIRFQDRLSVEMHIDPATLDARVPNLILQPLVENAIRHGVATQPEAGLVLISARRDNGQLRLQVRDNGPGLAHSGDGSLEGVGLTNTRARLEQLYGSDHRFDLVNAEGGGLAVQLAMPLR